MRASRLTGVGHKSSLGVEASAFLHRKEISVQRQALKQGHMVLFNEGKCRLPLFQPCPQITSNK